MDLKSKLKPGDILVLRNNEKYVYLYCERDKKNILLALGGYYFGSGVRYFSDDLKYLGAFGKSPEYDVVSIYRPPKEKRKIISKNRVLRYNIERAIKNSKCIFSNKNLIDIRTYLNMKHDYF